jgi:hypothetical protein
VVVAKTEPKPEHVEGLGAGIENRNGDGGASKVAAGGGGGEGFKRGGGGGLESVGGGGGSRRVRAVTASLDVVGGNLDGPSSTATFGTP